MKRYQAELLEPFETTIIMRGPNGESLSEAKVLMRPGVYLMRTAKRRNEWIETINAEAGRQIARAL